MLTFIYKGSSSGILVPVLCEYLTKLLLISPKYLNVIKEAGLLNIMSLMLTDTTEKLKSKSSRDEFTVHVLSDFGSVINCIVAMTSISTNVEVFQQS